MGVGSNLGNALTALGLEDKFLSNGDLLNLPLSERGLIANGIIAEKLKLGRWQGVVRMMYGGFGKADALYEGDRNKLRNDIVRSATEHPISTEFGREILNTLAKAGENDLLFRLATNVPSLDYEAFNSVVSSIDSSYFDDAKEGVQRKQKLHQTAADKAMKERKYDQAFYHFTKTGNKKGIEDMFDAALTLEHSYYSKDLLEKIALGDPAQRDEKLKRMILSSISKEKGGVNPLEAFELSKRYSIKLSPKEKSTLQQKVAKTADRYDIERKLSQTQDSRIRLLWAKKHAKDEPRAAYTIFTKQKFDGNQVIAAVQAGLGMKRYQNEEMALGTSEVSKQHLRRAYETASFDVKVKIASHLQDSRKLQKLSRQAHEKGNLNEAYGLWVSGKGNLNEDYINGIRTSLIKDDIENHFGIMAFLDDSDTKGVAEAYDTLMKTDRGKRTDNLRYAYKFALELGDEDRIHKSHKAMVAISPEWAICNFISQTRGNDETGLDYALGVVAFNHCVNQEELRRIVEKYQTA